MLALQVVDWRPNLDDIDFKTLDESSRVELERDFSEEEIFDGLMSCRREKTHVSDDFNVGFLQEFWPIMKKDIVDLFQELYEAGSFVKSLNEFFFVRIAKFAGARNIRDFRSISLVGCIYKLIAKVLVRRTFIANVVIDELMYGRKEGVLCKLDMEKLINT